MPILDLFTRQPGETSPFNLTNHVPTAGGNWVLHSGSQFVISPDGFARVSAGGSVSITRWNGDVGSNDYEVAIRVKFASFIANNGVCAVLRGTSTSNVGMLGRMYNANGVAGTATINIQDANSPFTERVNRNISGLVADRFYYLVLSAVGNTFTLGIRDETTGLWLNSTNSNFDQTNRTNALTATVTGINVRGFPGIQDLGVGSDTTGSQVDAIAYGPPGSTPSFNQATAITLSGPTSGIVGSPSTAFTVGANGDIVGTITVTPSDSGGGGTFTPTSVTISSASPTATFTYTAGSSGNKTISVTNNGGLTNPANITYAAVDPATAITLSGPTSGAVGVPSSAFTVGANGNIVGTITVTPSDSGGGGTFTPTSVTINNSSPTATFTYTAGSSGNKTISVTNNGGLTNPASITYAVIGLFYPDNVNIIKSPTNWHFTGTPGSQAAETVWPGSYMRFRFNGTGININVDTTGLLAFPWVRYQVDTNTPTVSLLTSGQTVINITGLSAGDHEILIDYEAKNNFNQSGTWGDNQKLRIVSFGGATLLPATGQRPKRAILYGDSITAGLAITGNQPPAIFTTTQGAAAASASYGNHVGIGLDAEFDQAGCGGDGWSVGGVGGFPSLINGWNLKKPGINRDMTVYDYIVTFMGYNDGTTDNTGNITTWLGNVRAANPTAWIFLCVPFSGRQRTSITNGVANYLTANPSETKIKVIDLGSTIYQGVGSGYFTTDGIHPNQWQMGRLSAAYIGQMNRALLQSTGQGAIYLGTKLVSTVFVG